jgi:hypothetical protein
MVPVMEDLVELIKRPRNRVGVEKIKERKPLLTFLGFYFYSKENQRKEGLEKSSRRKKPPLDGLLKGNPMPRFFYISPVFFFFFSEKRCSSEAVPFFHFILVISSIYFTYTRII